MRQARVGSIAALALLIPLASALPGVGPAFVPEVVEGFAIEPLAALPGATAIAFGGGDGDGPDLYFSGVIGRVWRLPLTWTAAGPIAGAPETVATGFSTFPLGVIVDDAGALYVSDSGSGAESGRVDGRVWRVENGQKTLVVSGLPNGRHNTNNLRWDADGRLLIANGNPNDDGVSGGDVDVFPYSGAILSVDAAQVAASPAVLHWRDAGGAPIPVAQIPTHARNADFNSKVTVVAHGFRNVYDVAVSPTGQLYTGTNGADATPSQDLFYKIARGGTDYGFPFCYNEGTPGGTDVTVVTQPNYAGHDCSATPPAQALLGWHVCATGLDVPPVGSFSGVWASAAYVAECGPEQQNVVRASLADPEHASHNVGHKVARVALDANGDALEVRDFISGLHTPMDVQFGPDGAMYVADVDALYRVVQLA